MASKIPMEIVTSWLEHQNDEKGIQFLWTVCRNVSKTWRGAVDYIFAHKHLSRIELYTLRVRVSASDGYPAFFGISFVFDRLADGNSSRVVVKDTDPRPWGPVDASEFNKSIHAAPREHPPFILSMAKTDIDIPISDLSIDLPELSFDWKITLSRFFSKQKSLINRGAGHHGAV
ncbi:hypothetical protein MMC11_003179 [Xylographa trunciseda]|nr:hypothetical protein [Xylographa trunciseda]